jgi:hypothetical protein
VNAARQELVLTTFAKLAAMPELAGALRVAIRHHASEMKAAAASGCDSPPGAE